MKEKSRLLFYSLGGFLFLFDRFLKYLAIHGQDKVYLWKNFFGWEYFENNGIAFGLPLPDTFVLFVSPLLLFGLFVFLNNKKKIEFLERVGVVFITFGAISNYFDRLVYGFTVDYFRIFTSVINVADVMILAGVVLLLAKEEKIEDVI